MRLHASIVLVVLLGACSGGDDAADGDCADHLGCETRDEVCSNETERCTCAVGSGLAWECEPLACPLGEAVTGESCETAGLVCDTGFESPGNRCVGPELRWAACLYYHHGGDLGPPNGCPQEPPVVGAACCQGLGGGGAPPGCVYGSDLYDCVNDHWVLGTL